MEVDVRSGRWWGMRLGEEAGGEGFRGWEGGGEDEEICEAFAGFV